MYVKHHLFHFLRVHNQYTTIAYSWQSKHSKTVSSMSYTKMFKEFIVSIIHVILENRENVCGCVCSIASVLPTSLWPYGLQPTRLLCPWDLQARILEWVAISFSRGIFQTQGLNRCLQHYRQILDHWASWEACSDGYMRENHSLQSYKREARSLIMDGTVGHIDCQIT